MEWIVYVLISESRAETYVGITPDVDRRLRQHNGELAGGARTTKRGQPWRVGATYGPYATRGEAQSVEAQVKSRRGPERLRWS